jgi:nicotinate-nucleotide--dimethylbenzimidazole phosphoribosyltransferase
VGKWDFDSDFDFAARKKFDQLVKPPGSLGRLEKIVGKLSGIRKTHRPSVDPAAIAVFIADHGIAKDDSVTPWPQIITKQMGDLAASGKAAISAFAAANDLYLEIVNVGTVDSTSHPDIYNHRIGAGTNDVRFGPAMTHVDAIHALEIGARTAERLIAGGSRFLGVGEIGIGNTTIAAAIISYITNTPASKVTGRGSGISDETFLRKQEIVEKLAQLPDQLSGVEILERIGGYEIAAIAGFILRASSQGVPVLLDGVNTNAAALIASQIKESCRLSLLAAHNSAEPGATVALKYLELEPILDLGLRLGEGTGAALAIPILRAACRALNEMAQLSDLE